MRLSRTSKIETETSARTEPHPAGNAATSQASPLSTRPLLSVIVPLYNEQHNVREILSRVQAVDVEKQIVMVDDASTDGTREILKQEIEGRYSNVLVLYHKENSGKGASIRTALPSASGEITIIQDGDLEYDPQDYHLILKAFKQPDVDAVYGSRFTNGWPRMRIMNRFVNKLLAWMVRVLFGTHMTDEATCYKAVKTDILQSIPLTCQRFEFCPEVTAKLLRRGHKIVEVPISYEARSIAQGKKIRWTDGVEAIWTLLKYKFVRF